MRVAELVDREAIRECLVRCICGNDLPDAALWKSAYWPDASEDHGWYQGNAHVFVDQTVPMLLETMDEAWHQIGNMLIILEGDRARAQSYFLAYCRLKKPQGERSDLFAGGRFLDRLERRVGEWRISARITKGDWVRELPGSADWSKPVMQGFTPRFGMRRDDDPYRQLFSDTLPR
jgi:SnoaL-like domain